ncbi:sugar dehydrogenase complex small subunit [Paraburkholderia sp. J8-2]|uniref:sugar dehydrogenase complex small subunit n=1 Tax=Paraburkholderia sp. J8-2 TaxID=2805440 RepID=UPI0039F032CF
MTIANVFVVARHQTSPLGRQGHGGVPSDTVTAALKTDQPELASMVGDVMRAWYLGLVGETPNVQVVAFEKALMFDPVDDVLTIASYCRDVSFYRTHKPAGE